MAFGFLDSYMNMFGGKNSLMGVSQPQQGFGMTQPNWAQPNGFGGQGFQFGGNIGNQQMQGQPPMFNGQGPQQGIAPLQGQQPGSSISPIEQIGVGLDGTVIGGPNNGNQWQHGNQMNPYQQQRGLWPQLGGKQPDWYDKLPENSPLRNIAGSPGNPIGYASSMGNWGG